MIKIKNSISQISMTLAIITGILLFSGLGFTIIDQTITAKDVNKPKYVPGEIIVKFKEDVSELALDVAEGRKTFNALSKTSKLEKLKDKYKVKKMERIIQGLSNIKNRRQFLNHVKSIREKHMRRKTRNFREEKIPNLHNIYLIKIDSDADIKAICEEYKQDPNIKYAEPNYIYYTSATVPDDTDLSLQWALNNTGQTGGTEDADIDAPEAWDIETGNPNVVIAVVDTGVDWDHPDLAANIWTNEGEIPGDTIDNDGNGYVDDVSGWDFVSVGSGAVWPGEDYGPRDNDPMDFHGHGTHVSGIIGAVTNNNEGISGVSWNCRIMAVRAGFKDTAGKGALYDSDIAAALVYATYNGADIINMSFGGSFSDTIKDAIDSAYAAGVTLIAAAGNSPGKYLFYPAGYDNVLAVSAFDHNDAKAYFTSYGHWIDVAAPGVNIYSTLFNDTYATWSGTSMAAPHVCGVAGLILSKNPSFSNEEVRQVLRVSADDVSTLGWDEESGYGRINAYNALQISSVCIAQIDIPSLNAGIKGTVDITGTASGTNFQYYGMYYGEGITPTSWTQIGTTSYNEISKDVLGSWDTTVISNGLYTIKLVVVDSDSNEFIDRRVTSVRNSISDDWEWQNPLPQGNPHMYIWGNSESDVFAVGKAGTIFHYNGSTWSEMESGTPNNLNSVWGSSAANVFAVGEYGTILHYNGSTWSEMNNPLSDSTELLVGVWCSSENDAFAVGQYGTILHYNGSTWSEMNNPLSGLIAWISGVWGSSSTDVFAVGYDVDAIPPTGVILHYNGTDWSEMIRVRREPFYDIWGSSGNDVFAVGGTGGQHGKGVIYHYDGTSWAETESTMIDYPIGIWGSSETDVFAVGTSGTILHYNGSTWSPMTSGTLQYLEGVWGSSANNIFAVGYYGTILHYNGSTWSKLHPGIRDHLTNIWGRSKSDIFAVGIESVPLHNIEKGIILHYDGTEWSKMSEESIAPLFGVWSSSTSDVFAVGEGGTILHYNEYSWSEMESGTTNYLFDVWGSSETDVFTVGERGTILHYNGSIWSEMGSGTANLLYGIWGSSGSDIFAVGVGTILHYDGATWSEMVSGAGNFLLDAWGSSETDVFAVGLGGVILHYDGTNWSSMNSGSLSTFYGVWGSSGTDVFAVGYPGTILHYDGATWSEMGSGTANYLYGVWGSSGNDVFAVGEGGTILHYKDCDTNSDCDDGLYCNGQESCVGSTCQPGDDPCPGQSCSEALVGCPTPTTSTTIPMITPTTTTTNPSSTTTGPSTTTTTTTTESSTTTTALSITTTIVPLPECEVNIEPTSTEVLPWGMLQFSASTSCDEQPATGTYLWSVASPIGSSINESSGLYTAGAFDGTDTVTVIDKTNGDIIATAEVVVSPLWLTEYDKMWGDKKGENLFLLRAFRDGVLADHELGRDYIFMLYDNSLEILILFFQNPSLTDETKDVIDEMLPGIQSLLDGDEMAVSKMQVAALESLLTNFETKASPKLKTAIKKVKRDINRGEIFEQLGITISE